MSRKLFVKNLQDSVYRTSIFIVCGDGKEANKWARKKFVIDEDIFDPGHAGECKSLHHKTKSSKVFIAWTEKLDASPDHIATLSHELNHLTFAVMDYVGIDFDEDTNNEAFTYFQDSLLEQTLDGLKKFRKRKKK